MTLSAGIDLGSTTIKFVIMENGVVVNKELVGTAAHPLETALTLLRRIPAGCPLLATGYGRDLLEVELDTPTITEIKAHATGARFLFPECAAVIDIGGQDVKAIALDNRGSVAKFEMNDRCAAGTGKFLEVMAHRLSYPLDEFADVAAAGPETVTINSMCTVFAESELVGLLNRGIKRESIAHALHQCIAKRISGMFGRISTVQGPVLVTGGGSRNRLLVSLLGELLDRVVATHEFAQYAGAIGCARNC
jgi:(R)-2-hydroxyacyl-CoA dehydratese activating ATPase